MFTRLSTIPRSIRALNTAQRTIFQGKLNNFKNLSTSAKTESQSGWNFLKTGGKKTAFCTSLFLIGGGGAGGTYLYLKSDAAKNSKLISNFVRDEERQTNHTADVVKERIKNTYGYVFAGIASTGVMAFGFFKSGFANVVMRANPFLYLGVTLASMIPMTMALYSTDYTENPTTKHALFIGYNAIMAAALCPIVCVGGAIVAQAAIATGCVVGGLSFAGLVGNPDTFSSMQGPLGIGLGAVVGACIGSLFFPIAFLENVALYGGLVVFSGLTMTDTSRMQEHAKKDVTYDPINESMLIYLDFVNIFIRIVNILANKQNK